MIEKKEQDLMTFGGHLEVLRRMLFRIIFVAGSISIVVFCFKDTIWNMLLAPSECNFTTYKFIEKTIAYFGIQFRFEEFHIDLIATDLSSQFILPLPLIVRFLLPTI